MITMTPGQMRQRHAALRASVERAHALGRTAVADRLELARLRDRETSLQTMVAEAPDQLARVRQRILELTPLKWEGRQ